MIDDAKHFEELRFENRQLKEEIELLKSEGEETFVSTENLFLSFSFRLKCKERLVSEEELRALRQQVKVNEDYRLLIAKKDAEIRVKRTNERKVCGKKNFLPARLETSRGNRGETDRSENQRDGEVKTRGRVAEISITTENLDVVHRRRIRTGENCSLGNQLTTVAEVQNEFLIK